jgi:ferric-dicitrate binding protein FerR (iron transport regulator)
MQENYLAKWLNNELSEEELKAFRATPEYETYQKIAHMGSRLQGPDFDVEAALARVQKAKPPRQGRVIRLSSARTLWKAAAAIAILLGITYFYMNSLDETVRTDYARQTELVLPDASEVLLNADSELSYSEKDWGTRRRVLLDGEAFFKVAKGQTFTVETQAGTVAVLGTEFNVLQRDGVFLVSCYEGVVQVSHLGEVHRLPAGKGYRFLQGDAAITEVTGSGPSWVANESAFKSMPLSFVLEEFERQFDLSVETRGVDTSTLFTGTFSNTNVDLALQSISAPLELRYSLDGNKVRLYATASE